MSRKYLFILLLVHSVLSDECVRYVFEDYNDLFTTEVPPCTGQGLWSYETYYESIYEAPNEKSDFFIKPLNINTVSCTGSFTFTMMPGALVEVTVYVERGTALSLTLILLQRQDVNHPTVGEARLGDDVENGWHVIRLTNNLIGDEPFQGYVGFLGSASEDSVLIVDSFRYIPLHMDPEEECILYEDIPEPDTTTTEATTTPTTEATTTPTTEFTTTPTTIAPTTTETTTTTDSSTEVTTASPSTDSGDDSDPFWTPLVITITVIACFIVLVIVAALSYYVGSLVAKKKIKVEDDVNYNYDIPQILPRVNRVYPEINSNKYNTQP